MRICLKTRRTALLLASLLAALPPHARGEQPATPRSGWVPAEIAGGVSDDNPAAIERIQFGNQFQNQGLDQWCDQIPVTLPISQDLVAQMGSASFLIGGAFTGNRQFFRYPDGEVAINDQLELKIDLGYALGLVSRMGKAVGVFFGGSIDGQSLVTRPMHGANSCKELKRLLNPFDFKTVLPLNAKRLSQMDVGELWIIPMTFQIAFEPLDAAYAPPMGRFKSTPSAAYLSIGSSKTSDPTITVFRVGPRKTRLKLHLDQVKAINTQLGAVFGPIPATDIGTPGMETLLSRILPSLLPANWRLFSRQFDDILGIQAGVSFARATGQQVLLQYTLDPGDPEQMENLARVIRGDLSVLRAIKSFAKFQGQDASSPAMRQDLDKLRQAHDLALKLPTDLAGVDDYQTRSRSGNFSVPVVVAYSRSTTWSQDHYVTETPESRDIRSYKVLKQSNLNFFHFPLVGAFFSSSQAQGAQVIEDESETAGTFKGKPFLVLTQEWGILRERKSAIAKALAKADALLSSVGAGSDASLRLPDELLSSTRDAHYHKGYLDMSLVFGPQAVEKIVSAPAEQVLRAFAEVFTGGERALFDFILQKGTLGADGSILFGRRELEDLPEYRIVSSQAQSRLLSLANGLCTKATSFVQKLSALRALEREPQRQAEALFRLASGKAGVHREDFVKIALKLVSAGDVAGDVLLHLDKEKTSASNYTVRYVLNPALFGDVVLRGMSIVERGFIAPTPASPLND